MTAFFEIETVAVALRTCCSEDSGIILTDFSCAYSSVDHRWIFLVWEPAGVPRTFRLFLCVVYNDSITSVRYACAARGQFAMMRGVRQGCPARGYLFTMAVGPVCRWLISAILPPEPHRPWFLQRCACADADEFALTTASLRESLPIVANAFTTIDTFTGMSLNHKSVIGFKMRIRIFYSSRTGSAPMSQSFGNCRSRVMPCTWALKFYLAQLVSDKPRQGTNLLECARASAPPRRVWSKDSSSSALMLCLASLSSDLSLNLTQQP